MYFSITTQALAMENGAAGDSIRVRNLSSKKDFTAFVVYRVVVGLVIAGLLLANVITPV